MSHLPPWSRQERLTRLQQIDLYPVTCERLSAGRSNIEIVDALLAGGVRIVQLRDKEKPLRDLLAEARLFRQRTREAGALLIINDRLDLALACGADGVHLGQDDLPCADARRIAPDLLLGISTHNKEQALTAEKEGADYVNIGPLFPTSTKEGVSAFLGLEAISTMGPLLQIPFTVMGGIKEEHLPSLRNLGATRVAMVTALTQAPDVTTQVQRFRQLLCH